MAKKKQIPIRLRSGQALRDDNQKGNGKGAARRWPLEVEVEKRISPLHGSQMREPLRSK
jgi:hypothetical protein